MPTATGHDLRPVAVAGSTAAVSLLLMYLAATHGWLGADTGRGSQFCEAARSGWLKQPANALSNLGFVTAGVAVGRYARLPHGRLARPGLATAYAVVVVLLGPGSMAMHATQTDLGGHLDLTSMFLVSGFAAAYALMRFLGRGPVFFAVTFAIGVVFSEIVDQVPGHVAVVDSWGNLVFGTFLLVAIILEVRLRGRNDGLGDVRWIWRSLGAMALAFGIWNLAKDGSALCHPHSLLQGHAAWHLLCAVSAYCLYRYWASAATGARSAAAITAKSSAETSKSPLRNG